MNDRASLHLSLPFDSLLPDNATVLVAGMGGGFDVYCGLPIYFELRRRGYTPHLANLSFSPMYEYLDDEWLSRTMVGVGAPRAPLTGYHPERYLAQYFHEHMGEEVTVWCFDGDGAQTLADDYRLLVKRLGVDAIVLIDGGIDSLMRGDEEYAGSILDDFLSIAAVSQLPEVPVRIMTCIAMGAENDIFHGRVFENIASLTMAGGLLGVSALVAQTEAYRRYEEVVAYVHAQVGQQPSVINASVISSAQGHFGDYHATERTRGSELWISPLMSLYWFFDVDAVAAQNVLMRALQQTNNINAACGVVYDTREQMALRPAVPVRLPLNH